MSKRRSAEWHVAAIKAKTAVVGDCWIWRGFIAKNGYGQKDYGGKSARVHRLMYELTHGVDLPADVHVCHSCDTRLCCNPAHLWVGDGKANAQDVVTKGRHYASLKTHCPMGHAYAEHGYSPPKGRKRRDCKVCARARNRIAAGWPPELAYVPAVPKGLRPVNGDYKALRNTGKGSRRALCKRGHPLEGENVYVAPNGNRQCAICRRNKRLEHESRMRLQAKISARNPAARTTIKIAR
jgi:hypothetical protein